MSSIWIETEGRREALDAMCFRRAGDAEGAEREDARCSTRHQGSCGNMLDVITRLPGISRQSGIKSQVAQMARMRPNPPGYSDQPMQNSWLSGRSRPRG